MTLTQVGKYMPEGLRALANLLNMLFEAAAACKVSVKIVAGLGHMGVNLDGGSTGSASISRTRRSCGSARSCRIDPEAAAAARRRRTGRGELGTRSLPLVARC